MKLLIATTNKGKIKEFREMLGGERFTYSDLSTHADVPAPEETGNTFRANACLKAAYYATRLKVHALADDSGLQVDALGGSPGVHSARWAAMHHAGEGDAANNQLLMKQLGLVEQSRRTGRFVCCLALADPEGRILVTAQDSVEGVILRGPLGTNGFGYDPLFMIPDLGRTAAELAPEEKHRVSHRGKALGHLRALMVDLPL